MPAPLAALVTERIGIPTIGIGAGPGCDGQVLVFNDLVGLSPADFRPKFLKRYVEAGADMQAAIERYSEEVRAGRYPDDAHAFAMDPELVRRIRS